MKRGYAIEITTRYYFTSTRLAKINKADNWGCVYSRHNHPQDSTSPLAVAEGSPKAPNTQNKPTFPPTFISPTSTVNKP